MPRALEARDAAMAPIALNKNLGLRRKGKGQTRPPDSKRQAVARGILATKTPARKVLVNLSCFSTTCKPSMLRPAFLIRSLTTVATAASLTTSDESCDEDPRDRSGTTTQFNQTAQLIQLRLGNAINFAQNARDMHHPQSQHGGWVRGGAFSFFAGAAQARQTIDTVAQRRAAQLLG